MIDGFENERATFLTEEQTGVEEDPYGESEPVYEWSPVYEDVAVRTEQRSAEYVREMYGEWPQEVYRLYVDPRDIGDVVAETEADTDGNEVVVGRSYELGVAADDRVELAGVTGQFALQPPTLQRLDSEVPEHVELEVTRVEV
ncbi:hypothetical protein [Halorussus halobius]|uniref:hypothetical protein n=1 Tax=Halorussus halobius TaxID=1710537 RepID=UPI00109191BC|nr:hypothetical protein [Halorussus halobius]